MQEKFLEWAQERDETFKKGLAKLREEIVKANAMAKEASLMAEEMTRLTEFHVTLQIPAANLTPSKIRVRHFFCLRSFSYYVAPYCFWLETKVNLDYLERCFRQ